MFGEGRCEKKELEVTDERDTVSFWKSIGRALVLETR